MQCWAVEVTSSYHRSLSPRPSPLPRLLPTLSTPATFDVLALYTDDLVVRLDTALCCRFANASATRFFGADAPLEGLPLATLGGRLGDVLRAGESAIETTFRTGQPQAYTFEGSPALFEVRVLPEVVAGAVPSVLIVARGRNRSDDD